MRVRLLGVLAACASLAGGAILVAQLAWAPSSDRGPTGPRYLPEYGVIATPGDLGSRAKAAPGTTRSSERGTGTSKELRVPPGYRTTYQSLGSWAVAADQGKGAKELHVVYASPGTIPAYRKTRHFPDSSILVKEVFQAVTVPMTTGTVSRAGTLKGWFVMVRDSRDRHAGDKLWGNGWGWGWFDAADPSKTTSTDFTKDCQPCHVPARGSEWVYVSGYPPLNR